MSAHSILQPGQLEPPAGAIPELFLPAAHLYRNRAERLRQMAAGHALAGYFYFLAGLAEWQQCELDQHADIAVPDIHVLAQCREHAMPPLAPAGWARQPLWQEAARRGAEAVAQLIPGKGRDALMPLFEGGSDWLETQADVLLHGPAARLDLAAAPFIGAALQVQWTHMAQRLQPSQVGRPELPILCPVCGSHPVASVIRAVGAAKGLRYLHCALCGSEWHVVRATCSQCTSTKDIGYYGLEGAHKAVRAEVCSECLCYLKVLSQEEDANVDPIADDIATLTLDLLLDEEQRYVNIGINFFMM